jgi:hypothetical protein
VISESRLIKILRNKFQGQRLSVKSLSKEVGYDFKEFYPTVLKLRNLGIVSSQEIDEIGREFPLDVIINSFVPPRKESILKHPLMVYVIYPLIVIFIGWLASIFWDNAQPSGKVDQVQHVPIFKQQNNAIELVNSENISIKDNTFKGFDTIIAARNVKGLVAENNDIKK